MGKRMSVVATQMQAIDKIHEMAIKAQEEIKKYRKVRQDYKNARTDGEKVSTGMITRQYIESLQGIIERITRESYDAVNYKTNKEPLGRFIAIKAAINTIASLLREINLNVIYGYDVEDCYNYLLLNVQTGDDEKIYRDGTDDVMQKVESYMVRIEKIYCDRTDDAIQKVESYMVRIEKICSQCHGGERPKVDEADEENNVQKATRESIQAAERLRELVKGYIKDARNNADLPEAQKWLSKNKKELARLLSRINRNARLDRGGTYIVEQRTANSFGRFLQRMNRSEACFNNKGNTIKTFILLASELRILSLVLYALL